ncbi:MAG: DUF3105 domain-containing protein [Dehalococcoidia bacterium]|nr:DUF3105 domain-containing protein [Dehalococcoidia bacterium]
MAAKEREQRRRAHHRAEIREMRRTRQHSRQRIRRILFGGVAGLGGLVIVLSLVLPSSLGQVGSQSVSSSEQGVQAAIQRNEDVEAGEAHPAYNTTPPTSGWHYDIPLEDIAWGALDEPVEDEEQVSYLERGGIMVQYNCPDECPDLQQQLEMVVNRYPEGVVLAPYPGMNSTIALTAWGWIDTFRDFDDPRIDDFIQTHIGQGPDSVR